MALTLSPVQSAPAGGIVTLGGRKAWVGFVLLDNSYPTGGYPFSPSLFGMAQIDQVLSGVLSAGNAALVFTPAAGAQNGKLQVITATTGAEAANATNFAGVTVPVFVIGV